MSLLQRFNPGPGFLELWAYWKRPTEYRWTALGISVLLSVGLFSFLAHEKVYIDPPRPEVTYITTFAPDRTDEEIAASNEANQQLQDEIRAAEQEAEEKMRDVYRTVGRYTGVDTSRAEAKAEIERREEAAERAAWRERMMGEAADSASAQGSD